MRVSGTCVVVGGGLVGACTALALQEAGVGVTLVEPGGLRAASWGNAGHLATEHVEPLASPATLKSVARRLYAFGGALDFVWGDAAAWGPWAARFLRASTPARFAAGVEVMERLTAQALPAWDRLLTSDAADLLRTDGHWVVWEGEGAGERGARVLAKTRTGPARHRPLTAGEQADLAPHLRASAFGGARFEGTGQVTDLERLAETLQRRFADAGGQREAVRAVSIASAGGEARVACPDGRTLTAAAVVVAAGVWSRPLLATAGLTAPLIAERGYHIGFQNPDWPENFSPVVFDDRAMVVTRFAHGLRATSFVEFGRAESPPDPSKWSRLEAHARAVGVLKDGPVSRWMGARPTLPDYLPAIGGGEVPGLHYALGHAHLGLTLAALTGELVRDHVLGRPPAVDLAPLSLVRFGRPGSTRAA